MRFPAQLRGKELDQTVLLGGARREIYAHDGIAYEAVTKPHIFANGRVGLHCRYQPLTLQNRQLAYNR